jgi:hypothetical protein
LVASALFFQNIPATLEPPWSSPAPARDYTGLLTAFFYIMNPTHLGRPQCHTGPYGTPRPTLPPHPLDPPYPPPPPHEGNKYLVVSRCVVPACPARFTLGFFFRFFRAKFQLCQLHNLSEHITNRSETLNRTGSPRSPRGYVTAAQMLPWVTLTGTGMTAII